MITITDLVAPTWSDAAGALDITLSCEDAAGIAAAQAAAPVATDNCSALTIVETAGAFVAGACAQAGTYTNTFVATDACTNASVTYTQVITITDLKKPTIATPPAATIITCTEIPVAPGDLEALDNCDASYPKIITPVETITGNGCTTDIVHTYTWTTADACGNIGTASTTITIPKDDKKPEIATPPVAITLTCGELPNIPADLEATDNCDASYPKMITPVETITGNGCTTDIVHTYTWTSTDACGNVGTAFTTVTIPRDVTKPIISGIPTNITLSCGSAIPPAATYTATDNCDATYPKDAIFSILPFTVNVCTGYTITRVWSSVDACGNNAIQLTQVITILPCASPSVAITNQTTATCGLADGSVTVSGAGGSGVLTYSIDGGAQQTSNVFNGLVAGVHVVSVRDANGCTGSVSVTINSINNLTSSIVATTMVSCNSGTNGSVQLASTNGLAPYQYAICSGVGCSTFSVPQSSALFTNLMAGTYSIKTIDANGCTFTNIINITEPAVLTISTTVTNVTCAGIGNGSISANAAGGTAGYVYAIAPSPSVAPSAAAVTNTSGIFAALANGTYDVYVLDAKGCVASNTVSIASPSSIMITTTQVNSSCFAASDASISITATGGSLSTATTYGYAWSTGAVTQTISSLMAGVYSVTVTDDNGCQNSDTITITQPTLLSVNAGLDMVKCNGESAMLMAASIGGSGAITYQWSDAAGIVSTSDMVTIIPTTTTNYTVTATDANGCVASDVVNISVLPSVLGSLNVSQIACSGGLGAINAIATNGTSPYTYIWSNAATSIGISNLVAGVYSVTITDDNGCTANQSATINAAPVALTLDLTATNASCNGANDASIVTSVTGGTLTPTAAIYSYLWSNGAVSNSLSGLVAGAYTVTVSDANGCSAIGTINTTEPAIDITSFTLNQSSACQSDAITITATGAIGQATGIYSISPSVASFNTSTGTFNSSNAIGGTNYTITFTSACGIFSSQVIAITNCTLPVGALSGMTWHDINNNGLYDGPDSYTDANGDGIYNATETYVDVNGDGVYTSGTGDTYTDANSNGMYDYGDSYTDVNANGSYDVTEPYTDSDSNGIFTPAEVYNDTNANGFYNAMEHPISGVTVILYSNAGVDGVVGNADDAAPIATQLTNSNGMYLFTNLLPGSPAINYYVNFPTSTTPFGALTIANANGGGAANPNDFNDSDANATTGNSGTANVTINTTYPNIDAGYYAPSTPVFTVVNPCVCMNNADAVGANFLGQFESLIQISGGTGPYSLVFNTPNVFTPNPNNDVNVVANTTNIAAEADGITDISIKFNTNITSYSFTVTDAKGIIYNAGPYLSCNYPTLIANDVTACEGEAAIVVATTTGNGITYDWNNGATSNSVSLIAGSDPSVQTLTVTITDNQGCEVTDNVNLIVNCSFATIGEPGSSSVSNMVYLDADSSFNFTPGDLPVAGAIIILQNNGPDGIAGTADDFIATTTSDINGHYEFNNLPPGEYTISISSSSYTPLSVNGSFNTLGTTTITLTSGENENPLFGFIKPGGTALSVNIAQWQATDDCGAILLKWKVGIEDNMLQYLVQHSADGIHFNTIAAIAAANQQLYNYTHQNPLNGTNYYRLLLQEASNTTIYSATISEESNCASDFTLLNIYPNPADNILYFDINANNEKNIALVIIDEIGRLVINRPVVLTTGKNTISLETDVLAKAVYYAGVIGEDGTFMGLQKIVITR